MIKLRQVILLLLIVSCSSARITSENQIPITFSDQEEHSKKVKIEYQMDYFLWGLVPKEYSIKIDELFIRKGYSSIAKLNISHKWTFLDVFFTAITLGFYSPQTFLLEGKINPYQNNINQ